MGKSKKKRKHKQQNNKSTSAWSYKTTLSTSTSIQDCVEATMRDFEHLWVYKTDPQVLLQLLKYHLKKYYYDKTRITHGDGYLYVAGELPVLLVAHVDTVHTGPPAKIYYHQGRDALWSPTGLGGDDRAGVAAILELVARGHRPHILFCDEEEQGGIGARKASKELSPQDIKYIIEFDRRGKDEAVFYDCDNSEFTQYILSFGWREEYGSFSDISYLCPGWGIAGVNLSIGYHLAHTTDEYVVLSQWRAAVDKAETMLRDAPNAPVFEYVERPYSYSKYQKYWNYDYYDYYEDAINISYEELVMELSAYLGGSVSAWEKWISSNHSDIVQKVYDVVLEAAAKAMVNAGPDFAADDDLM